MSAPAPGDTDRHVPEAYEGKLEPNYYCRAWNKKRQKYCRARAGSGTTHPGAGRCKNHDGGGDGKTQHGQRRRYQLRTPRFAELVEHHAADPDPLNIYPELAAARSLFQDFIERYEENTDALLAWHASFQRSGRGPFPAAKIEALRAVLDEHEELLKGHGEGTDAQLAKLKDSREAVDWLNAPLEAKPHTVLDISDAYRIVGEITKIAERIERIRRETGLSLDEVKRLMFAMGRVVAHEVADAAAVQRIEAAWMGLRV